MVAKLVIAAVTLARLCMADCPLTGMTVQRKSQGTIVEPINVQLKYTNASTKTIVGAKFRGVWLDQTNDPMPTFVVWASDAKTKPGAERKEAWQEPRDASLTRGWYVAPIKILYEDGSTWEEQDHACYAALLPKGAAPRKEPPAILFTKP
jgi:hypothetical protein